MRKTVAELWSHVARPLKEGTAWSLAVGALLFSANRLAEALPHLQRAVELLPASDDAHADLGGALAEAGRRDEALDHLRRAIALDPAHPNARENLARLERLKSR